MSTVRRKKETITVRGEKTGEQPEREDIGQAGGTKGKRGDALILKNLLRFVTLDKTFKTIMLYNM